MDVARWLNAKDELATRATGSHTAGLRGSVILGIAAQVGAMQARGEPVANFTIGDFDPRRFPIPDPLRERIHAELDAGQTAYPPAAGIPELRAAVRKFYAERLGLSYPDGTVQVGAGARPPIFAAFQTLLDPGDTVVYPVPSWNNEYYVYLNRAREVVIPTRPENGFMPTVDELLPHLGQARIVVLNSPLNPCGTVVSEDLLRDVCQAIVAENEVRRGAGARPLFLLYDQVYWQLVFGDRVHHTPVSLVPEMAPYTVLVDAISKCWAATGLRVGWSVAPPWITEKMLPLVGHMGAWAPRPEQRAAAVLLAEPGLVDPFMERFKGRVAGSLSRLQAGLSSMAREGLPVDCLDAEGAIYLSARFDLIGRRLRDGTEVDSDDAVRRLLLDRARVAVIPFGAFGYPPGSGWVRFSVGAVDDAAIDRALDDLRAALRALV